MKHILLLPALLLAAPVNAAVVRFDFISDVSVYQEDSDCLVLNEFQPEFCLGLEAPIVGKFILDVIDPMNIFFQAGWAGDVSEIEDRAVGSGTLLSVFGESNGVFAGTRASGYVSVRTIGLDQYDIAMVLAENDPDFVFSNTEADWGSAGGAYYKANGYWTATVVEPAPIPLPASGLLMLGLLPVVAGIRHLRGRNRTA